MVRQKEKIGTQVIYKLQGLPDGIKFILILVVALGLVLIERGCKLTTRKYCFEQGPNGRMVQECGR